MNDNDDLLRSVLGLGRQRPSPSSLSDFLTDQPTPTIPRPSSNFLPPQPRASLSAAAARYVGIPLPLRSTLLPPIPQRIKILTPQQKAERELRTELVKMADYRMLRTLARVLPSLDTLAFADGREIETSILYIDIRKSTTITSSHIPENAAKMYKMFHKAMIWAGKRYGGEVGGFAGDRILIVFPFGTNANPKTKAAKTAIYMQYILNTVLNPILQEKFKHPLECGIGIDFGKILVVRVGQQGEGNNERIWAGNATNYASKLADLGTGIFIGKNVHDGMNPETLKNNERTWTPILFQDGKISHYKYTGIANPL